MARGLCIHTHSSPVDKREESRNSHKVAHDLDNPGVVATVAGGQDLAQSAQLLLRLMLQQLQDRSFLRERNIGCGFSAGISTTGVVYRVINSILAYV